MDRNERIYNKLVKKNAGHESLRADVQAKMEEDDEFAVYYHLKYNPDDLAEKQTIAERIKTKRAKILKKIDFINSGKVMKLTFAVSLGLALSGVAFSIASVFTSEPTATALTATGYSLFGATMLTAGGTTAVAKELDIQKHKKDLLLKQLENAPLNEAEFADEPNEESSYDDEIER